MSLRSLESVGNELNYLSTIGCGIVNFEDDNLFSMQGYTEELLRLMKSYNAKGLSFAAMNGITSMNLVPYVSDAIDAGFIEFNLSLVSADQKTANDLSRENGRSAIEQILGETDGAIRTLVFIILGLPGGSPEKSLADIMYLASLRCEIGVSPLYILPGVGYLEQLGLPSSRNFMRGSALYAFDKSFTRNQIASLWKFVRFINAVKNNLASDEDIIYFNKTRNEGVWYGKDKEGRWFKSFKSGMALPEKIQIKRNDGSVVIV